MTTVHIVDDHPVSRWGLQRALETDPGIRVTSMFESAEDLRGGWSEQPVPDLAVIDLYLADDLPCVGFIAEVATRVPVLVVSASRRTGDVAACRQVGARGFVHKSSDAETLVVAAQTIARGGLVFPGHESVSPAHASVSPAHEETDAANAAMADLSPRERQVLAYIANGFTHDQAARRLGISRHTVDTYLKRLRAKVGDGNKAHLTRMATLANVSLATGQD
jgi:DNA-binding NarL/FixJ family response regulator